MLTTEMRSKFAATKLFPDYLLGFSHLPAVFHRIVFYGNISQCVSSFPPFLIHFLCNSPSLPLGGLGWAFYLMIVWSRSGPMLIILMGVSSSFSRKAM